MQLNNSEGDLPPVSVIAVIISVVLELEIMSIKSVFLTDVKWMEFVEILQKIITKWQTIWTQSEVRG